MAKLRDAYAANSTMNRLASIQNLNLYPSTHSRNGKKLHFLSVEMPSNTRKIHYEIYGNRKYKNVGNIDIMADSFAYIFTFPCEYDQTYFMKFDLVIENIKETIELFSFYHFHCDTEELVEENEPATVKNIDIEIEKKESKQNKEKQTDINELRDMLFSGKMRPFVINNSRNDIDEDEEDISDVSDNELGESDEELENKSNETEKEEDDDVAIMTNAF